MLNVSVGSVNKIPSILAQNLYYVICYKRNTLASTHDLLGIYSQLSLLFGRVTNRLYDL